MLEQLFSPVFTELTVTSYLSCTLASFIFGSLLALVHNKNNRTTPSFLLCLIILPAVLQTVLMLVNGNLGTGVAIMGAFGLLRFRSLQYKPEEMISLFSAFAVGLATSAGYLGIAALFVLIVGFMTTLSSNLLQKVFCTKHLELRITIPENVNYSTEFEDLFSRYTSSHEMVSVKTTNMGSLYRISYDVVLNDLKETQNFINELRMRNGNLEISLGDFPESAI